jgi:hypothetical protein
MTDINETQDNATEGQEAEAGTVAAGHKFNVGDEATVIRGKLRGRKGSILKHNPNADTYAVELEDGTLAVVNAANLKAPVDSTVSVKALVSALAGLQADDPTTTARVAALIDTVAPGFSAKLAESTAV